MSEEVSSKSPHRRREDTTSGVITHDILGQEGSAEESFPRCRLKFVSGCGQLPNKEHTGCDDPGGDYANAGAVKGHHGVMSCFLSYDGGHLENM